MPPPAVASISSRHLALQLLLHLLRLLHHLLNVHSFIGVRPSSCRRPLTRSLGLRLVRRRSPDLDLFSHPLSRHRRRRARPAPSARPSARALRSALRVGACRRRRRRAAARLASLATIVMLPAGDDCASCSIQPRFASSCARSPLCTGANVNTTESPSISIFCACAIDHAEEYLVALADGASERRLRIRRLGSRAPGPGAPGVRSSGLRGPASGSDCGCRCRAPASAARRLGAPRLAACRSFAATGLRALPQASTAALRPCDDFRQRRELPQVDPLHERHLELVPRLRRARGSRIRRARAGRTRA